MCGSCVFVDVDWPEHGVIIAVLRFTAAPMKVVTVESPACFKNGPGDYTCEVSQL